MLEYSSFVGLRCVRSLSIFPTLGRVFSQLEADTLTLFEHLHAIQS